MRSMLLEAQQISALSSFPVSNMGEARLYCKVAQELGCRESGAQMYITTDRMPPVGMSAAA